MNTSQQDTRLILDAGHMGAETASDQRLSAIGVEIISVLLANYEGDIAVRLWDGTLAQGVFDSPCTIVIKNPGVLRDLILHRDLIRLAEYFLADGIDVEGDMESLFDLKTYLIKLDFSALAQLGLLHKALKLPKWVPPGTERSRGAKKSMRKNSSASIAHHYDVSNEFYQLWLDPEMVYSCAYFEDSKQSLAEAQEQKLDYLCRKLRLQPGQTLLDVGCGWGALAIWAAEKYGAHVHGITLSKAQQQYAQARVRAAGLEDQVNIELLDYRDLPADAQYDRVVSVGMFEHIGVANFPDYFGTVRRVLKPGGLFLNHGITDEVGWKDTPMTQFMNRYIFPDGELARISDVTDAMERAGFEMLDVEGMRQHYALTLRRWVKALEATRDKAVKYSSEATYRLWRLYMAGCAYHFEEGSIGLYQVLAGHQHQLQPLPLRRDDLYTRGGSDAL